MTMMFLAACLGVFVLVNKKVVVLGGGHAGIEAVFALSRMGIKSCLVSMSFDSVGRLSCNPAVGGLAKTHLVKEIDALGGVMGFAADSNALQYKTLNKTKGRAVWSTRAQVDKKTYPQFIQKMIKEDENISFVKGVVVKITTKNNKMVSVALENNKTLHCGALIVACGTFAKGLIHVGDSSYSAGRFGEKPSKNISLFLKEFGHSLIRLKTGTPPRISLKSLNMSKLGLSFGDKKYFPFSLRSKRSSGFEQTPCFSVRTNKKTHDIKLQFTYPWKRTYNLFYYY